MQQTNQQLSVVTERHPEFGTVWKPSNGEELLNYTILDTQLHSTMP